MVACGKCGNAGTSILALHKNFKVADVYMTEHVNLTYFLTKSKLVSNITAHFQPFPTEKNVHLQLPCSCVSTLSRYAYPSVSA